MKDVAGRLAEIVGITGAREVAITAAGPAISLAITLRGMARPQAVLERFHRILVRAGFQVGERSTADDQLRFTILV